MDWLLQSKRTRNVDNSDNELNYMGFFLKKSPQNKCYAFLVFVRFPNCKTLVWEKTHFQNISATEVYKSPCVIKILICGLVVWCLAHCAT